jgi:hypothetical protein
MNTVESPSKNIKQLEASLRPVMVDDWAESLVDLERAPSRRRHSGIREPAWAKDGGHESTEWGV